MSFLSPFWLMLGAVAAVPILLHLLRLRRGMKVEFPAVRFLLRAEREHRREMRLRNLALMLLRVAIVLAVALAAARPLGRTGGAGHAPTAIAVVLDNSMSAGSVRAASAGGGTALETLQRVAERILDAATPDDRVWLLTVDGQVTAAAPPVVRDAAGRTQPIGGAGDLVGAVERAASLVRSSGLAAASVVVLTDAQASAWPRAARTGGVPVTIVALDGAPPRNRAVQRAEPIPSRWVPRGAIAVAISSADSSDVRVALGERTIARTTMGPNGALTVRGVAERGGWVAGRVELAPDELRGDDVRHFAVFAGDAPAVRVDASAGPFARAAIETLGDAGRVSVGGAVTVTGAEALTRRPVLAFAPSDPVRAGAANRALAAAGIPWRFGDVVRGEASVGSGELQGVRVALRYALTLSTSTSADTLAMSGGGPWVVAGDGYVLVGSPLDVAATDLPVWPQFVPWLETLLGRYLLADGGRVQYAVPLERVAVPIGVDELMSDDQGAIGVHGRVVDAPARAGVYWMRRAGAVVGALVVNADPAESNLAPLDAPALRARITEGDARVVTPVDDTARAAFSTGARRPLIGVVLMVLIALLVLEAVIARASRATSRNAERVTEGSTA